MIDSLNEDCVLTNTPFNELYGIKISGNQNIEEHLPSEIIKQLINDNKESENAFFWYVLYKNNHYQAQYILSHNKIIAKTFANLYDTNLLSGEELTNVLYWQLLQTSFATQNKQIIPNITIKKDSEFSEPPFLSFARLAKQAIRKNYKEVNIFQAFKHLDIKQSSISDLFKLNFEGSIWFYINLSSHSVQNHISRLIQHAKLTGDKRPFVTLQESYNAKEFDCAIINAIAYLKNYDEEIIGSLGSNLKCSFIAKELFKERHLRKNPIKYRDSEFDFIVKSDYLYDFIASVHKRNNKKPDIYGTDKQGGFINYSFSLENDNPHICIIATSGSGKSVSKQKIMAQLLGLNFLNGECRDLGTLVKVRSYDIGFSDFKFVNLIKSNPNNNVMHIESDFYHFSYNIAHLPNLQDKEAFEADLQFNVDLISIILETQNAQPLTIEEVAFLKEIFRKIYQTKEYQKYRVRNLEEKNKEVYDELLSLGYESTTLLEELKEKKYNYLKSPLLIDIAKLANREAQNQQLKEADRKAYQSLASKLFAIDKLEVFSNFDKGDIVNCDFLSMDLNNFKESTLFTPIFLSIFQKTYLKDRDFAINQRKNGKPIPKLFYAIEEARNYFRVPYFTTMFEKLALEARKYNVHLCFIVQNAEHIPLGILKNIDTRIFLLRPDKKLEVIQGAKNALEIPKNVEIALLNTQKYEMCVWYSSGVFHMRFEINDDEMKVFSTNPNEEVDEAEAIGKE
ncbi:ATP-binding protein [Helicobacter sp. MIT 11-5569]|uniref:ATP-binding protein n=1 Tax=Helicobacter sp. MIT 11-5569 TaxID=1548151 RepID=UPI00051FCD96|nr:ATP-binding protein [Helicobacter sp. MIT 11-5569]TLD84405.1 ATP-binding protein [Helicobacter sp. MIT 11-5569]